MGVLSSFKKLSRAKKAALVTAILVVVYAILGFLIAPPILKSVLISNISEQIGRNASVKKVRVNPFALSIALRDFELSELDGSQFVAFDELYVNFQLSSMFRQAFTFAEIRLIGPAGQVKVLADGKLNFSDILASLAAPEPAPDQGSQGTGLSPIHIYKFEIAQGRLAFSDLSRPTPFETSLFPLQLTLDNFSTLKDKESPYGFTATLGKGTMLRWDGKLSVNPLSSQGSFEVTGIELRTLWEYVQDLVKLEVNGGSMDLAGQYKADLSGESIQVELMDAEVELAGFKLSEKGSDVELISVPSFFIKGVNVDLNEKRAVVASIHSSDGWFALWRTEDGEINYQELIPAQLSVAKDENSTEMLEQTGNEERAWSVRVNEVILENYGARVENRMFEKPMMATLDSIKANLKNLSNEKESEAEFNLALSIDKKGRVEVEGVASINPVSADLHLRASKIPMRALQAYLETLTQVQLASAAANWDAQLKYNRLGSNGPLIRLTGNFRIDDIKLVERSSSEDLANCESLVANGLAFDVNPSNLSVSEIVLKQPYAKVIIFPDATVNLANAFSVKESETGKEELLLFEKIVRGFELQLEKQMPIKMEKVRIENGAADFSDLLIKPNFVVDIRGLNGTINGLSSEPNKQADVLLEGKVDKQAPVKITGQMNPLSQDVYVDLALSFKNMNLTRLSPYSGRFAGHLIEKGKMSVDLKYKVSGNTLVGKNEIFLNQLTLGERVESPDATSLPLGLAIALLKDRDGNIELDVPVSGNLKDPEFNIGGVVAKAVGQVITKIITSPFALLASLVGGGGGEELDSVEFEFGNATLGVTQAEKLDKLAKALQERPALTLEIEGAADKQSDGVSLAEAELLNQLKRAKHEELKKSGKTVPSTAEEMTLSYDDFARLITQQYIDKFGKDPRTIFLGELESTAEKKQAIDQEIIISAAKQKLVESMPVDEARLRRLAQERATQIRDHLTQQGEIPADRLFLRGVEIIDAAEGETVRTHLTLSGT